MIKYIDLGDTIYFHFGVNDTSGSGTDGSGAAVDVRLDGASASAAPVQSLTPSLLSHANYPAGCYEVAVVATSGNGYANGSSYSVFASITADGQTPTGYIGGFIIGKIPSADSQLDIHGNRSGT